ncbi:hypothetical protein JHK85_015572 [Glycine max]|nr:hypothetical protein JHK85_015572 [Glycine max]
MKQPPTHPRQPPLHMLNLHLGCCRKRLFHCLIAVTIAAQGLHHQGPILRWPC